MASADMSNFEVRLAATLTRFLAMHYGPPLPSVRDVSHAVAVQVRSIVEKYVSEIRVLSRMLRRKERGEDADVVETYEKQLTFLRQECRRLEVELGAWKKRADMHEARTKWQRGWSVEPKVTDINQNTESYGLSRQEIKEKRLREKLGLEEMKMSQDIFPDLQHHPQAYSLREEPIARSYEELNDQVLPEMNGKSKQKFVKQNSIKLEKSNTRERESLHLPVIQPSQISLQPAITLNPKNWKASSIKNLKRTKDSLENEGNIPEKEGGTVNTSEDKPVSPPNEYTNRERRLDKHINDGTTEYSMESASLNVHKIPSISFTSTSVKQTKSRRRSVKTEKTIVVTEEVVQISPNHKEELQLKLSSTLPDERDLKPILKNDKPKFIAKPQPPTVQTVHPRNQHEPLFLPSPVLESPAKPKPRNTTENEESPQKKSALEFLGEYAKKEEISNSKKKAKPRPKAVDQSISHISQDVDFDNFMSTRLKRLELMAIDKESDVNVMKLRKELRLKDVEEAKTQKHLEALEERYDDDALNTSIRSQAQIEPRSKAALEMLLENEAEKDAKPTYKPRPQYDIPTLVKEEKKDTGEWAYQRKAKLEKLAQEIEEKNIETEKQEIVREGLLKREADKAAALRLKQLNKLIAEESEDEDLDELEGKKDNIPEYPAYEEPLNEPTFEQTKKIVKFDYKSVKPKT